MKIRPYSRIVVEGMDGSGKSILTNQLMTYLGEDGYHVPGYYRTPEPKPPLQEWWMEELGHARSKVTVHDRFFYPELVYGPVLRGRADINDGTQAYIEEFLRDRALLIYCRPRTNSLELGFSVEEQMEGVKENFYPLLNAYDKLMSQEARYYMDRFMTYDWEEGASLLRLLRRVAEYVYE